MKRTLLILAALISLNCLGQEPDLFIRIKLSDGNYILLPEKEYDILLNYNLIRIQHPESVLIISDDNKSSNTDILTLLNEYQRYSKECYNDSSKVHYEDVGYINYCYRAEFDGWKYNYILNCNDSTHYRYVHKQPTFEGFMEWLNTKY
jgi:hypothetical protein